MTPALSSLTSALLVVLLGASPLVGPVCALLCGHSGGAASRMHGAQQEHAAHEHAAHEHATHEHAANEHPAHTESHVVSASPGGGHFPRIAFSSGESCCAFDIASSVAASASRIQSHPTVLQTDGVPAALLIVPGNRSQPVPSIPVQARPDSSSGRAPLVLRI